MGAVFLACDMPIGPPLNLYQILSYYLKQYGSYGLHEISDSGVITITKTEAQHTYWSSSSSLPNIIKICLRVSKLWPAQDFSFRGDNYTTNKVRVVSLTRNTPTGPPVHPYQILSNYLKQYGSYGLHKISASGEVTI